MHLSFATKALAISYLDRLMATMLGQVIAFRLYARERQ